MPRVMGEKAQEKITNEERERAFQELAVFLFGLYKKDKQDKAAEAADAA